MNAGRTLGMAGPRTSTPSRSSRPSDLAVVAVLLTVAGLGWWWSIRMATDMDSMGPGMAPMSLAAFVVGWVAMMAAMMFPAIAPMVKLYARAAARGRLAPVSSFVVGYLVVWAAIGVPAYFAWRELAGPLDEGAAWVGRLAGLTFLAAAAYQITPLKEACLSHCRSPISFFVRHGGSSLRRPSCAVRLGAHHGLFCLGCCWAIMAILVVLGTMHLIWMGVLTGVIYLEKVARHGERFALVAGAGFAVIGTWLVADPGAISTLT